MSADLPDLKILNLANNRFKGTTIRPPLVYLRELDMSFNSLTTLDGIGEYRPLEILVLYSNAIKSIAVEIMKLSTVLQSLCIRSNQLSSIPYSTTNMRALKFIDINQNQMHNRHYYRQRLFQVVPIRFPTWLKYRVDLPLNKLSLLKNRNVFKKMKFRFNHCLI
ncbi:unnamed protein product, partial [Rotaria magnacalcarata]